MTILHWILFFTFAVLSVVPVVRLEQVKSHPKYRLLWFLSIAVFSWSVFTGLKMIVSEPFFVYYFSIITYPIVFLISFYIYRTFMSYMNMQSKPWFIWFGVIFFFINLLLSLTNPFHQLVLKIPYSTSITIADFASVSRGIFFLIHSVICYTMLLVGFFKMMIYLYRRKSTNENDVFPFQLILLSLIIGILLNLVHLYVYHFTLDPTYLFVVIITFSLYTIIYRRDFNINLLSTSKQYLLEMMREMYVISDTKGEIIEISKNLLDKFKIRTQDYPTLDHLLDALKKQAVIYTDLMAISQQEFEQGKIYLSLKQESFHIQKFKTKGFLTLLYDETTDVRLLREINYIKSHDLMTGIYNRNHFEVLRPEFEEQYPNLGIILIDVDGLKQHNDYLGHPAGDKLIQKFAEVLKKLDRVYHDAWIFRFGGDEFLIVIENATSEKLKLMVKFIEERTHHQETILNISFSYGMAIKHHKHESIVNLLKQADIKLYQKKSSKDKEKERLIEALKKESKPINESIN